MITVTKTVNFDLTTPAGTGIITMPYLLGKNYVRAHISKLFSEMEKNGLGEHVKGNRGRGQCEHLVKNDKTPDMFTLQIFEKSRGRPRKQVAEEETVPIIVVAQEPVIDCSAINAAIAGAVEAIAGDVAEIAANDEIPLEAQVDAGQVANIDIVPNVDAAPIEEAPKRKRVRKSNKKPAQEDNT